MKSLIRKTLNKLGIEEPRETAKFAFNHKVLNRPYHWSDFPAVIQIDISNLCGPKHCGIYCTYCWPQWKITKGDWKYGMMPMEQIEWILKQIGTYGKDMWFYTLFLNGDGLTDPRLPDITKMGKKHAPNIENQTFTNGAKTENAHLLCDPNLDWVCFTVSAHNKEVYKQVHRGDQFENVIKTMRYVDENHKPNQKLEVHYVITEKNIAYMGEWWNFMGKEFPNWKRVFSPLVASFDNEPSRLALGNLTTKDQEDAIYKIDPNSKFWNPETIGFRQPCVLWNNAAITCDGTILQCCNWADSTKFNYGNIADYMREGRSLRDYWMMRLANKQMNPLCRSCNLRHPQYKERLEDIRIKTKLS